MLSQHHIIDAQSAIDPLQARYTTYVVDRGVELIVATTEKLQAFLLFVDFFSDLGRRKKISDVLIDHYFGALY